MTINETLYVAILPIASAILIVLQIPNLRKKLTLKTLIFLLLALFIMGFSIYDGMSKATDERDYKTTISSLQDTVKKINDTLARTKDTLIKIGLSIDEKTGKLLLLDSQLLKKEFSQIFNYNYSSSTPILPDERGLASDNFVVREINDSIYIYPKTGTWVHAYFAHDTANSKTFISHMSEGMGTPNEVDPINVNGKIYNTHIWKMYDRAVYAGKPIALKLTGYKDRYLIFGDEGISYKRYIYKSGKVTWIPED